MSEATSGGTASGAGSKADSGGSSRTPAGTATGVALGFALAVSGLLGYAAYCKFWKPLPDMYLTLNGIKFKTDFFIASIEVVVIVFLLLMHRRWWAWLANAAMFAGFVGLSLYASTNGRNCGCFGDCFAPPKFFMPALDSVIALASLVLAAWLRAPRAGLIAAVVACAAAGGIGWTQATHFIPPAPLPPGEDDAVHRLMQSSLMADIFDGSAEPYALNWYIFVHSPMCSVCETKKRLLDFYAEQLLNEGDPALQVRMFEIEALETQLEIGHWDWEETPTAFLLEDGKLTKVWVGEAVPENAVELRDMLQAEPQSVYDMPSKLDADGEPIPLGTYGDEGGDAGGGDASSGAGESSGEEHAASEDAAPATDDPATTEPGTTP